MDQSESATREQRLLLECVKAIDENAKHAIRGILADGIDWTAFAQISIDRGWVCLVAQVLSNIASDMVPDDVLEALRHIVKATQSRNDEVFRELEPLLAESCENVFSSAIEKSRASASRALMENPSDAAAWRELGRALFDFEKSRAAIACYNRSIELASIDVVAWLERAFIYFTIGQYETALVDVDRALARDPRDTHAWTLRARVLWATKRLTEAIDASDRALEIDPSNNSAARLGIQARLFACDWHRRGDDKRRIAESLRVGTLLISPLNHRALFSSEAEHLRVARLRANTFPSSKPLWQGEIFHHERIRVAYLSTNFRDHVVADAIAGCFEHHDKMRFEITGISMGPDDGSAMHRRIERAFERFVDVQAISDEKTASMLRDYEIDIAVDLNGYIGEPRTAILAQRPAPVQVNYFGYPGTMGASFIDYIIADQVVIPEHCRGDYREQVVYLPYSYLPSDRKRAVAAETPSRAELGLPATGFVFACLNNAFKIGPEVFDVWMRLLREVENSVLWLLEDTECASDNLRREAKTRGVDPGRLVFARRTSMAQHMARQSIADLFLDTLPYNAHTTANDALWMGLPVLTCTGDTFPGRVAASALQAVGLSMLITTSLVEYEHTALSLVRNPERLAAIRSKLANERQVAPLFDTARLTRDLEFAYFTMWQRQQRGLPAASFYVGRNLD